MAKRLFLKTIYRNALDCASRQKGAKHYVQQQL